MLKLIITGKDYAELYKNLADVREAARPVAEKEADSAEIAHAPTVKTRHLNRSVGAGEPIAADDIAADDIAEEVHEIDIAATKEQIKNAKAFEEQREVAAPKKRGRPSGSKNGGTKTTDLTDRPVAEISDIFETAAQDAAPTPSRDDAVKALRALNTKLGFEKARGLLGKYATSMKIDDVPATKDAQLISDCIAASRKKDVDKRGRTGAEGEGGGASPPLTFRNGEMG